MARAHRPELAGRIFHVTARATKGRRLFVVDADRELFLRLLDKVVRRHGWQVLAWCLMGTHYHLLVQTRDANIARGMQFLNGLYGQWFNVQHGTRGHVFATRYFDVLIESDEHLLRAARYIALNPVAAGLCGRPADWKWSSYRALIGDERPRRLLTVDFLLRELSPRRDIAHAEMRRLVEDLDPPEWPPSSGVRP
jgi:putative transposase